MGQGLAVTLTRGVWAINQEAKSDRKQQSEAKLQWSHFKKQCESLLSAWGTEDKSCGFGVGGLDINFRSEKASIDAGVGRRAELSVAVCCSQLPEAGPVCSHQLPQVQMLHCDRLQDNSVVPSMQEKKCTHLPKLVQAGSIASLGEVIN